MTNSTWPSMILGLRRLAATVTLALPLSIFTATFFAAGAWAATHETVLYSFGGPRADGLCPLRRTDIGCRWQFLRHDDRGRHLRPGHGIRIDQR